MKKHIAIDLGASGGRLILGEFVNGRIQFEELHRFENRMQKSGNCFYWDIDSIFLQLLAGLEKAKARGIMECTVGIDTWGVDYVLIGSDGKALGNPYAYRDPRTDGAMGELFRKISRDEVYRRTGIQFMQFNTLFQLSVHNRAELDAADKILYIPDYLYYLFTGKMRNEITIASTSQLLNAVTGDYDSGLLATLGLSRNKFPALAHPGEILGKLLPSFSVSRNLPACEFISVASHDTASAVLGAPLRDDNAAYLSSGTWSLLGAEAIAPELGHAALDANFTNERGAYSTFRVLKNIMGLWLVQELRRTFANSYSFQELADMAKAVAGNRSIIDCSDSAFLNPENMVTAIQQHCRQSSQPVPETPGELARCIFDSLALCYKNAISELASITGKNYDTLHIVGGGSQNQLLCQLTANACKIRVEAGPAECTAIGNIAAQMIACREISDIQTARAITRNSFDNTIWLPS